VSPAQHLGALVLVLAAWTLFAKGPGASAEFPTPSATLDAASGLVVTRAYWDAVAATLVTATTGFLLAVVVAVPTGLFIGSYRRVRLSTQFLVDFGRTIPDVSILPVLLLVFGNTRSMAVGLVVFGASWPMLIQSMYASQQTSPQLRAVAEAFRLTRVERLRFIFAPSMLPFVMAGLRLGATFSLVLTVTAEYLGQTDGIGLSLQQMQQLSDPPRLFVYVLTAAGLGVTLNLLLAAAQRRLLWWHPSERGATP